MQAMLSSQLPPWTCSTWLRASNKTTNLVAIHFQKPDIAIRPDQKAHWDGAESGQGELADLPRRRDAPDLVDLGVVSRIYDIPEIAIRSRNNAVRLADMLRHWKLTERAGRSHAPNPVVPTVEVSFAKPEVAVRPCRDDGGIIARGEQGKLADRTCSGDAPDYALKPGVIKCDEPEVAVRPGRKNGQVTESSRDGELADCACGGDAPDLVVLVTGLVVAVSFAKPEGTIRPRGDADRGEVGSG